MGERKNGRLGYLRVDNHANSDNRWSLGAYLVDTFGSERLRQISTAIFAAVGLLFLSTQIGCAAGQQVRAQEGPCTFSAMYDAGGAVTEVDVVCEQHVFPELGPWLQGKCQVTSPMAEQFLGRLGDVPALIDPLVEPTEED